MIDGNTIEWLKENLKIKLEGRIEKREDRKEYEGGPIYHRYINVSLVLDDKIISEDTINLEASCIDWSGAKEMNALFLKQRQEYIAKHNEALCQTED